jgi:hypothetical protein
MILEYRRCFEKGKLYPRTDLDLIDIISMGANVEIANYHCADLKKAHVFGGHH